MPYPRVYLLRHGQTEWNVAGRLQGRLDSPLTPRGVQQAERQAQLLQGFALQDVSYFCSPQGRARQTAEIAFAQAENAVQIDPRLKEITAGSWDGVTLEEIERTAAPLYEQARNAFELMFLAPDGEGEEAVLKRCRDFLDSLDGPAALVTHGATLCVLRGLLLQMSFDEMLDLGHEQGCVYVIENAVETIER